MVDVEVCTNTGCSYNPAVDELAVYPPGNPKIAKHLASEQGLLTVATSLL